MPNSQEFDLNAAHNYFAANCFNKAWDLIEKSNRTPEDDRMMFALNQASIYHWFNRPDCEPKRLSVGYWQASRIQALLGNATEAQRYAEVCLQYSADLDPFYLGFAFEAVAREQHLLPVTIPKQPRILFSRRLRLLWYPRKKNRSYFKETLTLSL